MPSPTTALQLIEDALGLTNAVGVDQTLTAEEVATGLRAFNDLLEIFSTRNLAVYGSANQSFNTVIGQSVYTIGTGGDWNTARPSASTIRLRGLERDLVSGRLDDAGRIQRDPLQGADADFPDALPLRERLSARKVTLFPVPSAVTPVTFSLNRLLTSVASAAASISFPPGYAMVFTYKLAIMLAPRFGKKVANYPEVVQIANDSFADICRANKTTRLLSYGADFGQNGGYGSSYQRFIAGG
jgi:hypothetical protein